MEEMLAVFDENGNLVGKRTRSFCHSEKADIFHKAVWIWIINDKNQVLVQKRSKFKKNGAGLWDMPIAGHVDAGEDCLETCKRETFEELGILVPKESFKFLFELKIKDVWEFSEVYILHTNKDISEFYIDPNEVEEIKWLNIEDFKQLLFSNKFVDHSTNYKNEALNTIVQELKNLK